VAHVQEDGHFPRKSRTHLRVSLPVGPAALNRDGAALAAEHERCGVDGARAATADQRDIVPVVGGLRQRVVRNRRRGRRQQWGVRARVRWLYDGWRGGRRVRMHVRRQVLLRWWLSRLLRWPWRWRRWLALLWLVRRPRLLL